VTSSFAESISAMSTLSLLSAAIPMQNCSYFGFEENSSAHSFMV
jgi:hypothetical protein